jgi:hypothetical protein
VVVPEVDLIDAASLPAGLSRLQKAAIAQGLMRRRVFEWAYSVKKNKK